MADDDDQDKSAKDTMGFHAELEFKICKDDEVPSEI
jgi:hypothetical protein